MVVKSGNCGKIDCYKQVEFYFIEWEVKDVSPFFVVIL